MNNLPLVSIGIPTYNRAGSLSRAIESALAQDYGNLEIVISDNASTDETQTICEKFAQQDARVRYFRQPVNQGAAANFNAALQQARGEFFMWLSDDDWLGAGFIEACAQTLMEHKDYALVCGRTRFIEAEICVYEGEKINLPHGSPARRVESYYEQVAFNGTFYGLMRRKQLLQVPFSNQVAGDWLLIAAIAFMGKVKTLDNIALHRSTEGASKSREHLCRSYGLSKFKANNLYGIIAMNIYRDIAWKSSIYQPMGRLARQFLGWRCFVHCYRRYGYSDIGSPFFFTSRARSHIQLRTRVKQLWQKSAKA